jgi:VIT1/CCC1 family predicted Fe2+/Mn2+ transporter
MLRIQSKEKTVLYVRNIIFGVEDSLVSTVGLLSGIVVGGVSKPTILLTGVVLIFVEAFSMAIGSLLSEYSAEEYLVQKEVSMRQSTIAGMVMFASYFCSGFLPFAPYLMFPIDQALWISIFLSISALAVLGVISARISHVNPLKHSLRVTLLGGLAIAAGVSVGTLFHVTT